MSVRSLLGKLTTGSFQLNREFIEDEPDEQSEAIDERSQEIAVQIRQSFVDNDMQQAIETCSNAHLQQLTQAYTNGIASTHMHHLIYEMVEDWVTRQSMNAATQEWNEAQEQLMEAKQEHLITHG